ncbi:MAG: hypothetical protein HYR94_24710, partial [Chloroflexi bacterium]|nr:hypothetical protein [Chloroflexota bacterium]
MCFDEMQIAGEMSLYFVPLLFENEVVQSILPKWLNFAPPPDITADKYPVIFTFAQERRVRFEWGIITSPSIEHKEVGVGVPWVQLTETGQGPFYSFPQLYLDKLLPVILGKYWWGFAKQVANIQTSDGFYAAVKDNRLLVSGEFKPCGEPGKPSDFPFFEAMAKQKLLQETPVVDKTFFGSYLCAKLNRDTEKTVIQPVEAKVQIADAFLPGLPLGEYTVKGINEVPMGALHMRAPWTMSMPMSCGAAKGGGSPTQRKKTLGALEQQARAGVDKVRDNPEGRYQLRLDFYQKYGFAEDGGPGYGQAELAFMRWAIARGVLNPLDDPGQSGSPWWRAVNEEYLYLSELAGLMYEAGLDETSFNGPLRFWLAYLQTPSSLTWYRAHNASIVHGYLNQVETAKQENRPEQIFVNIVLYRVLYAQA